MKINTLSKKDTAILIEHIKKSWNSITIPKFKNIRIYEIEKDKNFYIYEDFHVIKINDNVLPFIGSISTINFFPSVIVDMGAVKFVCNGAKVTRPGIVKMDNFKKNDIVVVKDEQYSKPLAVGIAMENSQIASSNDKGYVVDNMHYVGDKFWNLYKEIKNTSS